MLVCDLNPPCVQPLISLRHPVETAQAEDTPPLGTSINRLGTLDKRGSL